MLFETKRLCDNRSSFFVTVATVLSDITPVLADGELIMKLHYHREDGAYDGWDAWLWPDGGEGGGYAFADEGGEMVSGTVHIYVESGVEGYTKEYGEDAVTAQGVPFIMSGEEMLRSKPNGDGTFNANSYASGDAVNSLKWSTLEDAQYQQVYEYYKGLIAFRKAHSALRMTTATDIQNNLTFMSGLDANVVAYTIANNANGDTAEKITVIFNGNKDAVDVKLPAGTWEIFVNDQKAGTASVGTAEGTVSVAGISAMVLVQGDDTIVKADDKNDTSVSTGTTTEKSSGKAPLVAGGIVAAVIAIVAGIFIKKRKK